jgi:hypothetical protein
MFCQCLRVSDVVDSSGPDEGGLELDQLLDSYIPKDPVPVALGVEECMALMHAITSARTHLDNLRRQHEELDRMERNAMTEIGLKNHIAALEDVASTIRESEAQLVLQQRTFLERRDNAIEMYVPKLLASVEQFDHAYDVLKGKGGAVDALRAISDRCMEINELKVPMVQPPLAEGDDKASMMTLLKLLGVAKQVYDGGLLEAEARKVIDHVTRQTHEVPPIRPAACPAPPPPPLPRPPTPTVRHALAQCHPHATHAWCPV